MAVDVGSAVGYLDLDISGFLAGLKSAQSEADKQSKNIATTIGNNISGLGKGLTSVGKTLTAGITTPLVSAGAAAFNFSKNFETALAKVQTIADSTSKSMGAIKDEIVNLSNETGMAASELAEATYEAISSGIDTASSVEFVANASKLATAGFTDTTSAVDVLTTIINAYGMSAEDATHISDVLISTQNKGKVTVDELASSMGKIIPTANAFGVSLEDLGVGYSFLTAGGIKAAESTTYMNGMFNELGKSGTIVSDTLKNRTGKSFQELMSSGASLRDVLQILSDEAKETGVGFNDLWGSQEAGKAAQALLMIDTQEYNDLLKDYQNTVDDTSEAYDIMADTTEHKLNVAMQNGKNVLMELGDTLKEMLLPFIEKVVGSLQKLNSWLSTLSDEQKEQVVKWAAIIAAIGPVLVVFGKLVSAVGGIFTAFGKIPGAIKTVTGGFTTLVTKTKNVAEGFKLAKAGFTALGSQASPLGAALAGVTGPMIAIVAAVALVIAAFVSLWKNNEEFRNKITAIWDKVKATFEKLTSGIVERLNRLGFDFSSIGEVLKAIWKGFCDFLAPIFEGVFNYISIVFETFVNVFLGIWDFFHALFTGDWQGCWDAIKGIFESIWNGIKDWFSNILNVIVGVFDVVLGWFGTSWTECWTAIKDFFVNLWNGIVTWFQTTLNNIATFFTNIWTSISTFFSNIWTSIATFLQNAWNTIKNVVQVGIMFIVELVKAAFNLITLPFRFIWENCKETIISIWNTIKSTISNVLNSIKTTITNVWNSVKTFFTTVWTAISTFISTIWNSIKNTITTVINAIKSVITSIFNVIKSTITTIWNGIKTTVTNVVNGVKTTVTNVFNAIKSTATSVWNSIKSAITTPLNAAKTAISNVVNSIKSTISSGFNAAKSTVSNVFNSIKNSISNVMNSAKTAVQNAINNIKSKFNFSWSLPKLKMPHPKISGSFSLNPPSVPKFSIEWYKKAMNGGMILNGATIFGMDNNGNFLGGGEAGSETIVGTASLLSMIRQAVFDAVGPLVLASRELAKASAELGYVTYNGFTKLKEYRDRQDGNQPRNDGSGDVFVFNSPKAIDEIEAAKQMKRTKRELAEGF